MTIRATTAIAPSYAVGLPPNAGSEWHPHQSSAWVGTPNDEGFPELLSHVATAAHLGRRRPYRCRVSQTRHFGHAWSARPGLPAGRCGTLGGPTRCDRLSTLNCVQRGSVTVVTRSDRRGG